MALPTENVPLHIFEDRYRTMIEECLEEQRSSGSCGWPTTNSSLSAARARSSTVIERKEDGRMNILARGTRPFRLLDRQDDLPYPAGVVEFLDEQDEPADIEVVNATRELYANLVEQATDNALSNEEIEALDAYRMAATVEFGTDAKQELLELRSENARLRLLTMLFRAAIKRMELVERAQAHAQSNGKVRFG